MAPIDQNCPRQPGKKARTSSARLTGPEDATKAIRATTGVDSPWNAVSVRSGSEVGQGAGIVRYGKMNNTP
jgi:hypothetical protein